MRKTAGFLLIPMMMFLLCGCGSGGDTKDLDTSSVEVNKDGTVTSILIEDFDESLYDVNELKDLADDEIGAFNLSNGDGSVELISTEVKDNKVEMVTKFANAEIYAHFNSETFIYETIEEARTNGQTIAGGLVDKNGAEVSEDTLTELSGEHVIITSNKSVIAAPYKIKYISSGSSLIGSYMADLSQTDAESIVYIVLNK